MYSVIWAPGTYLITFPMLEILNTVPITQIYWALQQTCYKIATVSSA